MPTSLSDERHGCPSLVGLAVVSAFLLACTDTSGPATRDTLVTVYDSNWNFSVVAEGWAPYDLALRNDALYSLSWGDSALRKHSLTTGAVTSLVTMVPPPHGAVSDGEHLYWISEGSVYKTSINGSSTTVLAHGQNYALWAISDLALDDTHVYFVNSRNGTCTFLGCGEVLWRVPKSGGGLLPVTVASGITAFAVADGHVFWAVNHFLQDFKPRSAIWKRSVGGGADIEVVNGLLNGLIPPGDSAGWNAGSGLAVKDSRIYFGATGRLLSVSVNGGAVTVLAENAGGRDIAVDENRVYWLDQHALRTVPKAGGPQVMLAGSLVMPTSLELRGATLYWVENTCNGVRSTGLVRRLATSGGTPVTIKADIDCVLGVVADGTQLFWIEGGRVAEATGFGRIGRMSHDGTAATVLTEAVRGKWETGYGGRFDVDAKYVYFYDWQTIKRVPENGGPAERVAISNSFPADIATDGEHVYWTGPMYQPGAVLATVQRAPVSGGPATTVGSSSEVDASGPGIIRLDSTYVYWTVSNNSVLRAPKAGGAATVMAGPIAGFVADFVVANGKVYIAERTGGRLMSMGSPEPTMLAQLASQATRRLATDGTYLYWIDETHVGRIALSGGLPEFIVTGSFATNQMLAHHISVAATGVYWTDFRSGKIRRAVPK